MLKIHIRNFKYYKRIVGSVFLRRYFLFDILKLDEIDNEIDFSIAIDHVRLSNGTYKTTAVNRFRELDEALVGLMNNESVFSIHDLAVSDGSTSCELFDVIKRRGFQANLMISDMFSSLTVYKNGPVTLYVDSEDKVIYGSIFKVLADKRLSNRFMVSKLLGWLLPARPKSETGIKLSLLSPRTKTLIREGVITFKKVDVFDANDMKGAFDVVRCMNVLNRSYFKEDNIIKALDNIRSSLRKDGLLVIGRTDVLTRTNYASIFKISSLGAKEIVSLNGGSEIAGLIFSVFGKDN